MKIIPARASEIKKINQVITASKAHWNYPKEYFEKSIQLILVDEAYLIQNESFELLSDTNETIGFLSFSHKNEIHYLDNLGFSPQNMEKDMDAWHVNMQTASLPKKDGKN